MEINIKYKKTKVSKQNTIGTHTLKEIVRKFMRKSVRQFQKVGKSRIWGKGFLPSY